MLSLLYRGEVSADPATAAAEVSVEPAPASAEAQLPGAEVLTKRAQAKRAYAELSADGARSALGSWPPLLGSARATPAPWSPSSRPDHPRSSTMAAAPPEPTCTLRPDHDRRRGGRLPRRQPRGRRAKWL